MPSRTLRKTVLALSVCFGLVEAASAHYSPRLGRFVNRNPVGELGAVLLRGVTSAAPFVPRDSIREQRDLYRYVGNGPISAIDPLGLSDQSSQPTSRDCCRCGPDVTDWLVDQLNRNMHSAELQRIQELWGYEPQSVIEPWYSQSIAKVEALLRWRDLVKAGARLDFKASQKFESHNCPSPASKNTVTLCGICFYYDVPGNIHYGFLEPVS